MHAIDDAFRRRGARWPSDIEDVVDGVPSETADAYAVVDELPLVLTVRHAWSTGRAGVSVASLRLVAGGEACVGLLMQETGAAFERTSLHHVALFRPLLDSRRVLSTQVSTSRVLHLAVCDTTDTGTVVCTPAAAHRPQSHLLASRCISCHVRRRRRDDRVGGAT